MPSSYQVLRPELGHINNVWLFRVILIPYRSIEPFTGPNLRLVSGFIPDLQPSIIPTTRKEEAYKHILSVMELENTSIDTINTYKVYIVRKTEMEHMDTSDKMADDNTIDFTMAALNLQYYPCSAWDITPCVYSLRTRH